MPLIQRKSFRKENSICQHTPFTHIFPHTPTSSTNKQTNKKHGPPRFVERLVEKKVLSWALNSERVGIFPMLASSEFQRDGAMKPKEPQQTDFRLRLEKRFSTASLSRIGGCVMYVCYVQRVDKRSEGGATSQ